MLYAFITEKVSDNAVNVLFLSTFRILRTAFYGADLSFYDCGKSPVFFRVSSERNGRRSAK